MIDPMDIEIKFEDYRKDNKEETNSQKEKREESGQLSEERDDEDAGRSSTNPSPTPSNANVGGFRSARRKVCFRVCGNNTYIFLLSRVHYFIN